MSVNSVQDPPWEFSVTMRKCQCNRYMMSGIHSEHDHKMSKNVTVGDVIYMSEVVENKSIPDMDVITSVLKRIIGVVDYDLIEQELDFTAFRFLFKSLKAHVDRMIPPDLKKATGTR